MNPEQHAKISASHLVRRAYVDVRQSTLRQVLENTDGTDNPIWPHRDEADSSGRRNT